MRAIIERQLNFKPVQTARQGLNKRVPPGTIAGNEDY